MSSDVKMPVKVHRKKHNVRKMCIFITHVKHTFDACFMYCMLNERCIFAVHLVFIQQSLALSSSLLHQNKPCRNTSENS